VLHALQGVRRVMSSAEPQLPQKSGPHITRGRGLTGLAPSLFGLQTQLDRLAARHPWKRQQRRVLLQKIEVL